MKKIFFLCALCASLMSANATEGALSGGFTINADGDQIVFSQGNLQYKATTDTWQFAANQYDAIGADNANIAADYSGWIDLFGWGTGSNPTLASTDAADYATFTDWGDNAISNGGNKAGLWRTMTKDEWQYLFYTRENAAELFGLGTVNGVNGTIVLPDDWQLPVGVTFTASSTQGLADYGGWYYDENDGNHFSDNTYTAEQWANRMEPAGAVFLPCGGVRNGTDISSVSSSGDYWSATLYDDSNQSNHAYNLLFYAKVLNSKSNHISQDRGMSVRLVQNPAVSANAIDGALSGKFTINVEGDQVAFSQGNLQYRASIGIWQFASNQYDDIGSDNKNITADYSGWIDLFGWGTGSNPTLASTDDADYTIFSDWGTNAIRNGGNEANAWRTLTMDEWEYLFYTRENAATLFGLGKVNGYSGMILLPDNWTLPEGVSFNPSSTQGLTKYEYYYSDENLDYTDAGGGHFYDNTYTAEQWTDIMEPAGAVFLTYPAGSRDGTTYTAFGGYWSNGPVDVNSNYVLYFDGTNLSTMIVKLHKGCYVRLVQPAEGTATSLEQERQNGNMTSGKKILRNGQLLILTPNGKAYNALGIEVK